MDPNANLREQLTIAKFILSDKEEQTYGVVRLAELIIALDEWITKGGFLPERWMEGRNHCSVCGRLVHAPRLFMGRLIGPCCWDDPKAKI